MKELIKQQHDTTCNSIAGCIRTMNQQFQSMRQQLLNQEFIFFQDMEKIKKESESNMEKALAMLCESEQAEQRSHGRTAQPHEATGSSEVRSEPTAGSSHVSWADVVAQEKASVRSKENTSDKTSSTSQTMSLSNIDETRLKRPACHKRAASNRCSNNTVGS